MGLYAVAASQLVFWLIHTVDRSNLDTFLQKRNSKTRVWLPPKIRSLKLVHSLCLLVNPLASNNDFP